MKKVIAILFAVLMLSTLCLPAFAASDINADEQRVIDVLDDVVNSKAGKKMTLKVSDINHAKNFMMRDEINLTKAQADEIIAGADKCYDIVVASGLETEKLTDMKDADRKALMAAANEAGAPVGVTVEYNFADDKVEFTYQGTIIATVEPTIKITGADYTMLFVIMGAAVVALAALAVVVKKTACAK